MFGSMAKTLFGVCSLGLFAIGIRDVFLNFEPNLCEMTYMFEYPNYVPIPLSASVMEDFAKYGLYVYGEGTRTVEYQRNIFSGIPVLFIPGNAGSYRQGRSLGSVLLRMAEKRHNTVKFDVFTIDFDEELSGLYGGYLSSQTDFVLQCLLKISSLYGKSASPKIILVGHSVGGILARGLFVNPSFDTNSVNTIFTLSTPHQPILIVDTDLAEFYQDITTYWSKSANTTLKDVVLVSFAGGHRDVLVRSERSDLTGIFDGDESGRFVSMTTTSVPAVWASTDHLCIVWCKQLTIVMGRALFEMVDSASRRGLVADVERRVSVVHKYFTNPKSEVAYGGEANGQRKAGVKVQFFEPGPLRLVTKKFQPSSAYTFSLDSDTQNDVVLLSNHWTNRWIHICFDAACNDTQLLTVSPTRYPWFSEDPNFYAIIPYDKLKGGTFLLFELTKSDDIAMLQVQRTVPEHRLTAATIFQHEKLSLSGTNYFRLNVPLSELWECLDVIVVASGEKCASNRGVLRFTVPGFVQDTHKRLNGSVTRFALKLQSAVVSSTDVPQLELFLNPACEYQVDFEIAWMDVFGQFVRFYVIQMPAFFAAVVVVQLLPLYRGKSCAGLDHILVNLISGIAVLSIRYFPDLALLDVDQSIFPGASVPATVILWVLSYTIAYWVIHLFETALQVMVTFYSYPVHFIAKPFVSKLQKFQKRTDRWSRKVLIFPIFAAFTTAFAYLTCGENAVILSLLLYFVKVCYKTRNDVLSKSANTATDVTESSKILLLAVLVTMVNVIPTLVWTKRFPTSLASLLHSSYSRLEPDPSFGVSVVIGLVLDFALRDRSSSNAVLKNVSGVLGRVMQLVICTTAVAILVYAQTVFYMVNYFLGVLLTALSCDFIRKIFTDAKPVAR